MAFYAIVTGFHIQHVHKIAANQQPKTKNQTVTVDC